MSWSLTFVGVPDKIVAELNAFEATLTGQSLEEFQDAKPHLQALVSGNVGQSWVQIEASGHASVVQQADGTKQKTSGNVTVTIRSWYGKVCT